MPPSFSSPWGRIDKASVHRAQADVPVATVKYLQSLSPGPGIMINLIQSFFYALEHDCRNAGLTGWTPDSHAALVGFIRDRTSTRVAPNLGDGYVPGATQELRPAHAAPSNLAADFLKDPANRGGLRRVVGVQGNNKGPKTAQRKTKA